MKCSVADFAKDRTIFNMTDCTLPELENKLTLFLTAEGYVFKGEKDGGKLYTKGNRVLRILFGAFFKYYSIQVAILSKDQLFSVQVLRNSSGFSGGVIGMNQVKKEFTRLIEAFKLYFGA